MSYQATPESFLRDVRDHKLTILRDDGIYRHLRFQRPGTSCMHFELVTWPGYLAYAGDMGAFVFQRLEDMLQFFRRDPAHLFRIDFRYWAEKCEAEGARGDGIREWSPEKFKREITEQRRQLLVANGREWDQDQRQEFWDDLQGVINAGDDEHAAVAAVYDWSWRQPDNTGRRTIHLDTGEFPSCKTYTQRFLWCCYALAWGINEYDKEKSNEASNLQRQRQLQPDPAS